MMPPSQSERASFEYVADEKQRSPDHVEDYSNVTVIDGIQVLGLSPEDADFYHNFTPEQRKTVLHKVISISLAHDG
jgi:hypothetical protein